MRRTLIVLLALAASSTASLAHAAPAGWRVEHVANEAGIDGKGLATVLWHQRRYVSALTTKVSR